VYLNAHPVVRDRVITEVEKKRAKKVKSVKQQEATKKKQLQGVDKVIYY
jgi:hypothetical protein